MNTFHIYEQFAQYYDLVYARKNYKKDAEAVKKIITTYKKSNGKELLEVACGTGRHLSYLKKDFHITATDLHPKMLAIAQSRNSGVTFRQADMFSLNLQKQFDVVLCLFSSIGYAKTTAKLQKVIHHFATHLKPGGVLIIQPPRILRSFEVGAPHLATYEGRDVNIARAYISQKKGNTSVLELHYLIAERNKGVHYLVDRHELGLFTMPQLTSAMQRAGLQPMSVKSTAFKKTHGVCVAIKPLEQKKRLR